MTDVDEIDVDDAVVPIEPDDPGSELLDMALSWMQVNVLRLIATRIVPLVLGSSVVVALLAWLQDAIGLNLDPAVVTAFVVTAMTPIIGAAIAYVRNHGKGLATLLATPLFRDLIESNQRTVAFEPVPQIDFDVDSNAPDAEFADGNVEPSTDLPDDDAPASSALGAQERDK